MDWLDPTRNAVVFQMVLFLISIAAGVFGALLGLGGGVVIVPTLTLGLGIHIRYAIGASIVSVIATSSGAAATYVRDRITNVRVAVLLEVATTLGALCGAFLSTRFSTQYLFLLFSLILIYSATMMFRKRHESVDVDVKPDAWSKRLRLSSSYPDRRLGREIAYAVTGVPLGVLLMLGAGVISGLLGIGSGALKVPAMDTAMRLPIKVSSATSNFMIGVTAAASAGAYYMRGDILPALVAPVALGVLSGSWLGSHLMMRFHSGWIRKIFIGVLILVALQMGLKGLGWQPT